MLGVHGFRTSAVLRAPLAATAVVVLAMTLAGCATRINDSRTEELDSASRQMVADSLAQSADRAVRAQESLAQVERARTEPAPPSLDVTGLPPELRRQATMTWSGPGVAAARETAGLMGYEFRVVGNPPGTPPMVNVNARDLPVAKILEDIGLQVQGTAQVVVDANQKRVEFRYVTAYPNVRGGAPVLRGAPALTK
ncbi:MULTISPECIES: DotD/TraH family lipoprotein [unclassified Bradyrhizobium]